MMQEIAQCLKSEITAATKSVTFERRSAEEDALSLVNNMKSLLIKLGANEGEFNIEPAYDDSGEFTNIVSVQLSDTFINRIFGNHVCLEVKYKESDNK